MSFTTRVDEQTYVVAIWTCGMDGVDFLATLYRDARLSDGFILDYRFRYHAPDNGRFDPFDGRDRKSSYRVTTHATTTEPEAIAIVDRMVKGLTDDGFGDLWRVVVQGGVDKFEAAMATGPHCHFQIAPAPADEHANGVVIYHQEGCTPSDDPREACQCDARIVEPGIGEVIRPRGSTGRDVAEVLAGRSVPT